MQVEVASRNPQLPQLFSPLPRAAPLMPGEFLRTTCEYDSTSRSDTTYAGFKHLDEMCNLYAPCSDCLHHVRSRSFNDARRFAAPLSS